MKTSNRLFLTLIFTFGLAFAGSSASAQAKDACEKFSITTFSGITVNATRAVFGKKQVCKFFRFSGKNKPQLDKVGFFLPAVISRIDCPVGTFDGELCFLRKAPEKAFLYKNGFHAKPNIKSCPYSMVFDGVNCFWQRATFGTKAVSKKGNWYTTPRPGCAILPRKPSGEPTQEIVLGAFDGNVCRIAARPQNVPNLAIQEFKGAFYAISSLPKTN
jgi:hypothetical protein